MEWATLEKSSFCFVGLWAARFYNQSVDLVGQANMIIYFGGSCTHVNTAWQHYTQRSAGEAEAKQERRRSPQ